MANSMELAPPKIPKFHLISCLWKCTVSAVFRVIRPKLCGNCPFLQSCYTRKLGEITDFIHCCAIYFTFYAKYYTFIYQFCMFNMRVLESVFKEIKFWYFTGCFLCLWKLILSYLKPLWQFFLKISRNNSFCDNWQYHHINKLYCEIREKRNISHFLKEKHAMRNSCFTLEK